MPQPADRPSLRGPFWPVAHLLALAPLDVWLRLLARSGGVGPAYWPRLAFCLFTSWVGTVVTLPERLALWLVRLAKFGGDRPVFDHPPGVVVVLGYYRSGTTHLHNLLACDRRVVTPRWYQCLAGQGWWASWALVRFMLTPFLGSTRPQDGVGFGPAWPAEDDFAQATWGGASTLAGRFVIPRAWERERAWHALDALDAARLRRWRSLTAMFCWKVTRFRSDRVLVLKTPSHTARVAELDRLFAGGARFVSIERDRAPVIDSNLKMHRSLAEHALQPLPAEPELRNRIEAELDATEIKRDAELAAIDPARVVRVRYADLTADPMGQMGRISAAVGLPWDQEAERRVAAYLHRVGRYRPGQDLSHLPPDPEPEAGVARPWLAVLTGFAVALACAAVWLGVVWLANRQLGWQERFDQFVWLTGGMVGVAMARVGRVGSPALGWLAAGVTLVVFAALSFPITVINWNWWGGLGHSDKWWYHNGKGALDGVTSKSSLIFAALGATAAWRQASRRGPRPPG
jgi:hypothetical protein